MTSPVFRRHRSPAKWQKGSFNLPNKLVQDKNLTDSGFRLLAWMVSCSSDWIIYQTDIMKRFEWGRERLKGAIDNLIECKYLFKFPQQVLDGRYGPCDYAFESDGFTDEEIEGFKISLPMYGNPTSTSQTSTDHTSNQYQEVTNPKETTTAKGKEKDPAAVVFLDEEKEPGKKPLVYAMLESVDIPRHDKEEITRTYLEDKVRYAVTFCLDPTFKPTSSLAAAIKWACKITPEESKASKERKIQQQKEGESRKTRERYEYNKSFASKYHGLDSGFANIVVWGNGVDFKDKGGCKCVSLIFAQDEFVKTFKHLLKKYRFSLIEES